MGVAQPGGADCLAGRAHTRGTDHVRAVDKRNTPPPPGLDHLLVLREDGVRSAPYVGVSREHHYGRYVCRHLTVEVRHPPSLDLLQGPGCLPGGGTLHRDAAHHLTATCPAQISFGGKRWGVCGPMRAQHSDDRTRDGWMDNYTTTSQRWFNTSREKYSDDIDTVQVPRPNVIQ